MFHDQLCSLYFDIYYQEYSEKCDQEGYKTSASLKGTEKDFGSIGKN